MYPTPFLLRLLTAALVPAAFPLLLGRFLWPLPAAAAVGILAGTLLDAWTLIRAGGLKDVQVPDKACVGDRVRALCFLENGCPFSFRGRLTLEVTPPLEVSGEILFLLPADGAVRVEAEIEAPKRGEGTLAAVWLEIGGPMGLLRRVKRMAVSEKRIHVLPNLARVRDALLGLIAGSPVRGGLIRERRRGEGGEFDALEAYVPGMDPRALDWKASARHQELVARRYHLERNQRIVLAVDTGRLMGEVLEGLERLDHAAHTALLLSWAALKEGDLVGFYSYGTRPGTWLAPAGGMACLQRMRRVLGGLEVEKGETNHAWGMRDLAGRLKRRSMVVVFTEFTDPAMAALMVENVGVLAERHFLVFVALEDPLLAGYLEREPLSEKDEAIAVTASRIRMERRKVLGKLRAMGIRIVEGGPGKAALDTVKVYLEAKRRELAG